MDGWTEGQMDGQTGRQTDRYMYVDTQRDKENKTIYHCFLKLIFKDPKIQSILTIHNKQKEHRESPLRHRKVNVRVKPNIPAKE